MYEVIRIDTGTQITGEYKDEIIKAAKAGKSRITFGNLMVTIQSSCKEKNIIKVSVK